jgi:hypothetical protein
VKRFIHYFIFFVLFFSGLSCGAKKEAQGRILSQPEMVSTLIDVYVAEQKIERLNVPRDSGEFLFKKLNAKVLEAKNVQDSVLKKSFDYYLAHPKELEQIYSALVDSLNLREQRVISKPAAP